MKTLKRKEGLLLECTNIFTEMIEIKTAFDGK